MRGPRMAKERIDRHRRLIRVNPWC
jgi:hypothetical protein